MRKAEIRLTQLCNHVKRRSRRYRSKKGEVKMMRHRKLVFFMVLMCALFFVACGQEGQPTGTSKGGNETCYSCHSDKEKILADLAANPLLVKEVGASEGEG